MIEKIPGIEPEKRRNIKITATPNGYHDKVANNEYGLAKFYGQTGLLIPLFVYNAIGRDKIITALTKHFGNDLQQYEIDHCMVQKNAFVIYDLPSLIRENDSTGKLEENSEVMARIEAMIRELEDALEESEQNKFN